MSAPANCYHNKGTDKKSPRAPKGGRPESAAATEKSSAPKSQLPELMRFKECADDGNVCVKTITRWIKQGFLTEWRPHPGSRTRRIKRAVWEAFKQRSRPPP